MTSPFLQALADADVALDGVMGEDVQITPMRAGKIDRLPDPERPAFDVVALVSAEEPASATVPSLKSRVVYDQWRIEIDRRVLGVRVIKDGDSMILLDQPGSPHVRVGLILRDDPQRLIYLCGPEAS